MIAFALRIPGRGARTKVSGVSKRWSCRLALRVWPSSNILVVPLCLCVSSWLGYWPYQSTAPLRCDLALRKDRFPSANRTLHDAAERCPQIWTQCMTLQQVLGLQREGCGKIDQREIRAGADNNAASIRNPESPGRLGGYEGCDPLQRQAAAMISLIEQYGESRLHTGDAAPGPPECACLTIRR